MSPSEWIGRIAEICRYPVKSMRGESLDQVYLGPHGIDKDRLYAFESEAAPPGMLRVSGRERRMLLGYAARYEGTVLQVLTPEGTTFAIEDFRMSQQVAGFSAVRLTHAEKPQTDCRPLSLIGLETIARIGEEIRDTLNPLRFRANLYLSLAEPFAEDHLVGYTLRIGEQARVLILERDPRCRFITFDPDTLEPMPALMSNLHRAHQSRAGVYARILEPGLLRRNDPVWLEPKAQQKTS